MAESVHGDVVLRLLGPVRLDTAGGQVGLGPGKQTCLLACLLLEPGRPVPVETLIDRVWDDRPPHRARNVVATYVTRLRGLLRSAGCPDDLLRLRHAFGGYVAVCRPETVDLHQVRHLVRAARSAGAQAAAAPLSEALEAWQPVALAGVPGTWAQRVRDGLRDERLDAFSLWAAAELRQDNTELVIDRLRPLLVANPTAETVVAQMMTALARAGRWAEAQDCYAQLHRAMAEELGAEPAPALRDLHGQILRGDLVPRISTARPSPPVPAQLPADIPAFTGRAEQLAELDRLLSPTTRQPAAAQTSGPPAPKAAVISAVSGTAGVGKTALAVHWAHRVADRFEDGQLYVNLRGFDPGGQTMAPGEAVLGFLDALGVNREQIPTGPHAQVALYRSLMARKRMLVVLDNARDADQVRPLLASGGGCLTLVTSRNQLTGLIATNAAHPLTVDLLTYDEARELLTRHIGPRQVAADGAAVEQIINGCARLPLALTIAAARTRQTNFPLAVLAAELADARARLDALDAGEPASQVRAVFSWSYTALTPPAAQLFRLLSLHPGPDISAPAAASLAGHTPTGTRRLLAELTRAGLLTQPVPDRYVFHDLLRAYSTDLVHHKDSVDVRDAATVRVLDHYVHTAHAAKVHLDPHSGLLVLPAAVPGVTPEAIGHHTEAMPWFTTAYPILLAAIELAARSGFDAHAWRLAWTLTTFILQRGKWHDLLTAQETALAAADRLADPVAQALVHRELGIAHAYQGGYDRAEHHNRLAVDLFAQLGDRVMQARTHLNLGWVLQRQGRHHEALAECYLALKLNEAAGDRTGQARVLNAIAWQHTALGRYDDAVAHCEQAIAIHEAMADVRGLASTWDTLGCAQQRRGGYAEATICFRRSIELYTDLGHDHLKAEVLDHLGDCVLAAGDVDEAAGAWRQALAIFSEPHRPEAENIRDKLHKLGKTG